MQTVERDRQLAPRSAADALSMRAEGMSDLGAELVAASELTDALVHDPRGALRRCVELALPLCNADVAGVCLFIFDARDRAALQWEALGGDWREADSRERSRRLASCRLFLQSGGEFSGGKPLDIASDASSLQAHAELVLPLYEDLQTPLGALYIARLDRSAPFCRADARCAERLSRHALLAVKLLTRGAETARGPSLQSGHDGLMQERRKRRRAERNNRSLRRELVARDEMVREAHHRVKNTLQIAASLLSLRDAKIDSQCRKALRQARDQLFVLANVHDLLARGHSAGAIHVPSLLQAVCGALRGSFPETAARVMLRINADDVELPADDAIVLALAANELITNAYKHAFPAPLNGEISVSFQCSPANEAVLRVADTGVGIAARCTDGLGLVLVRALADQLHGALAIENEQGARVELRIPRAAKSQRAHSA